MITEKIEAIVGEKLQEVSDPKWSMFDDGGIEVEVGEFLYGFVRANKPTRVLETGTYSGISAMYMGMALKENGFGNLDTIEYEEIHASRSKKRLIKMGLQDIVKIHLTSSLEFKPTGEYDLIFLDTEPDIRFKELVKYYGNLSPGGYIFIHDLPRNMCQGNFNPDRPDIKDWPFGTIPHRMKRFIKKGRLNIFHLKSPRGLVGFYKPHGDDWRIK